METTGAAPSRLEDWTVTSEDLKYYPHFDAPLRLSEIKRIVNDPKRVASNAFFPLIQYHKKWQPFRIPKSNAGPRPDKKARKIHYAARKDAYIFARYRKILSPLYEKKLLELDVANVPLAYRKIVGQKGRGKCNIDFAKDVFDFIESLGNCYVISLDISKFFDSLDHAKIKKDWTELLGVTQLPADHKAVLKALTVYSWVDRTEAYERLGYFGSKTNAKGKITQGYLLPFKQIPKQLCKPAEFKEKIAGNGTKPNIIQKNLNSYGIPQGTPISDLIANIYLMDFDCRIKEISQKYQGAAFRYSDDILLVIKADNDQEAKDVEKNVRQLISSHGSQLIIKESKSSIHKFVNINDGLSFERLKGAGKNGLEYLGFRFDGKRVYLRDSTLSNLRRKIKTAGRIQANIHKKRYFDRDSTALIKSFNFDDFFQRFMRVEGFDKTMSVRNWTFWTYARRAVETFGPRAKPIEKQLKFLKPDNRRLIESELAK